MQPTTGKWGWVFVFSLIAIAFGVSIYKNGLLRQENAQLKKELTDRPVVVTQRTPVPREPDFQVPSEDLLRTRRGSPMYVPDFTPPILQHRVGGVGPFVIRDEKKWLAEAQILFAKCKKEIGEANPPLLLGESAGIATLSLLRISRELLRQQKYEAAQEVCQHVLAFFPEEEETLELSGDIYAKSKDNAKAREQYEKLLELLPFRRSHFRAYDDFDFLDWTEPRSVSLPDTHRGQINQKIANLPKQ